MASGSGQSSSAACGSVANEYRVRAPPTGPKRTFCITKFNNVDLKSCGPAKIERENNLKEYKLSHDVDIMPKFGAGSEFGREQREEARRKKYGVKVKKYNPAEQPYILKLGSGKQTKRYKGNREGGIQENASYYIFLQCPDGAFQFMPVSEWYKFTPVSKYKCLNSEEAEEEFDRRDRTLNYFSIMVRKRMKNDEEAAVEAEAEDGAKKGTSSKKKKSKDFMLTELDEWANMTDVSDEDSTASGAEEKPKKKQKGGKKKSNKRKANSDDEALEESDDMNEGHEVDYMTDSDSADEAMYDDKVRDASKYEEKGVEDEDGLRTLVGSDEEEEEEQKDEENEEEDKEVEETKREGSDSESSSGSDSDSDPEKDSNFASALFMQSKDSSKKKSKSSSQQSLPGNDGGAATSSRSSTPSNLDQSKGKKRKAESDGQTAKKPKPEPTTVVTSSDGVMQEAVKRYLMRKPMTTTDLIQKFKSKNTGLTKDKLVTTIAQILKQLNPERSKNKDKLFLFIRKTDK
ncbi:hypothetical protein LSAT2_013349 [Lamellibrachia satsuma]|nr:hypothetical protein LSAT2_013349 [Lamellibrachia satsuma]